MKKKHSLHPEVEQELRLQARKYLAKHLQEGDSVWGDDYVRAAEAGAITFDDLYFLEVEKVAQSISLENLVDMGEAAINEGVMMGQKYSAVDEDNPEFQRKIAERGRYLTGLIYGISPAQVWGRYSSIQNKVTEFQNRGRK